MQFSLSTIIAASALVLSVSAQTTPAVGTNCGTTTTHAFVLGDTINEIAKDNKVTVAQILQVNPKIMNPNFINLGLIVNIPNVRCVAPAPAPAPNLPTATCVTTGISFYVVVNGDTLFNIATQKLHITLDSLVAANPQIKDINVINISDVLNVPVCKGCEKAKKTKQAKSFRRFART